MNYLFGSKAESIDEHPMVVGALRVPKQMTRLWRLEAHPPAPQLMATMDTRSMSVYAGFHKRPLAQDVDQFRDEPVRSCMGFLVGWLTE